VLLRQLWIGTLNIGLLKTNSDEGPCPPEIEAGVVVAASAKASSLRRRPAGYHLQIIVQLPARGISSCSFQREVAAQPPTRGRSPRRCGRGLGRCTAAKEEDLAWDLWGYFHIFRR
jgi:hypothetical protein